MVWKSSWARSALYSEGETANNNQFNYPQNIYCGIGFVMQTQRRRVATTSDFLLHSARPFSRRFVVVIAWFSVCCFTRPSYQCGFSGCAAASIYTYHPDLRWVCHICCFICCLLLGATGLFLKVPFGLHARSRGNTWNLFGHWVRVCVRARDFPRFPCTKSRVQCFNYHAQCSCSAAQR